MLQVLTTVHQLELHYCLTQKNKTMNGPVRSSRISARGQSTQYLIIETDQDATDSLRQLRSYQLDKLRLTARRDIRPHSLETEVQPRR